MRDRHLPDNVLDLQDREIWQNGIADHDSDIIIKKHKAKHKKHADRPKKKRRLAAAVIILIILIGMAAAVFFVRVKEITVEGNEFYTDDQVKELFFNDPKDYFSAICWAENHFGSKLEIPFVSSYDIQFTGPTSVNIVIYERSIIGCIDYLGTYMYFDNDGTIVETSTERNYDAVMLTGLSFDSVVLYEKLPVENTDIFNDIMSVSQLLSIYNIKADQMQIGENGELTLVLQDCTADDGTELSLNGVTVYLGGGDYIEEKMSELHDMLTALNGLSGTLNMSTYNPTVVGHGYALETSG